MVILKQISLGDQVLDEIRRLIREHELTPGRLYSASEISERLNVSRSPVREALLRLAEAGMVAFHPNRGFEVFVPGVAGISEMVAVRLALEPTAARLAAGSADEQDRQVLRDIFTQLQDAAGSPESGGFSELDHQLHDHILKMAGNQRVREILSQLHITTSILADSAFEQARSLETIAAEHGQIVDAILDGNGAFAEERMYRHLELTGKLLLVREAARSSEPAEAEKVWNATAYAFTSRREPVAQ
ncbi:MAG: GntR family transcriptional regulator [Georgenia sp.]